MIMRLYSVFDIKPKIYYPPNACHNVGDALRFYNNMFQREGSNFNRYPEDYQVFELGAFDDSTGMIEMLQNPTMIIRADELPVFDKEDKNGLVQDS